MSKIGQTHDDSSIFTRQRRNLVLTSFLLIVVKMGGAEPTGEVNLIVAKFNVKDLSVVFISAWVVCAYFLVRYLQILGNIDKNLRAVAVASNYITQVEPWFARRKAISSVPDKYKNKVSSHSIKKGAANNYVASITYRKGKNAQGRDAYEIIDVPVSTLILWTYRARMFILGLSKYPSILEYEFPYILPLVAAMYWAIY